jgi:Circularly permutated YpsA SLOG family
MNDFKVISGGQTGADIAALKAAKHMGVPTGGYMTKGCRTLAGAKPEYIEEYGMIELGTSDYRRRTRKNVEESTATLAFASNFQSTGERCTKNACRDYGREYVPVNIVGGKPIILRPIDIACWIEDKDIIILNVAGNSETTCPGIEDIVYKYLVEVFGALGY